MMRCATIGLIFLSGACFVIGTIAVAIPFWGHFRNRVIQETGHFGPWTLCRDIDYGRKTCGQRIVMFRPTFFVYAAGVCSAVGVAGLGAYGLVSIFYTSLLCSPRSTLRKHKVGVLITLLILSLIAALMSWTSVGLFATQGDDLEQGYIITLGFSFWMEIVVAIFSTILMLLTIGEYVTARRLPDEPDSGQGGGEIGLKNVITNPAAYGNSNGLKHPHYHWGTGTGPPASGQAGAGYKTDRLHPHQDEPYHYASCGIGSHAGSGDEAQGMAGIHTQQGPYHSGEESSYGGSGAGWPSSGGAWKYGKSSNGAHHGDFEEDDRGEMKPILSGWSQPSSSFRKSPVAGRKKVETSLVSSSSRLSDPDLSRGKPVKIWDEESWSWKDGVKLGRGSRSSSKELLPLWPRSSPSPILGRRKSDPRTRLPKPIGILK